MFFVQVHKQTFYSPKNECGYKRTIAAHSYLLYVKNEFKPFIALEMRKRRKNNILSAFTK